MKRVGSVPAVKRGGGGGKEVKRTLQLIPSTAELKQRLRGLGANPFVQISFKPSKPLSFIIDYVLKRRYGAFIAADDQRSVAITFAAGDSRWTREDRATSMSSVLAQLKQPFRLTYDFDASVLAALAGGRDGHSNAEAFDAKTRTATTLFDASNSVFGSGPLGGGDSSLLGGFLSGGVGGGDARLFGESQSLGAAFSPPHLTHGPLAAHFENENSFSAFLGSPLPSLGGGSGNQPTAVPTEAKRQLFE